MKMKELEAKTGVGREAIRFYIREGLLPEPEKPQRNVANYSDDHVQRIQLIKKLQHERFLPLAEIRTVLDGLSNRNAPSDNLLGLEFQLAARLGANVLTKQPLNEILTTSKTTREEIEILTQDGLIEILQESDAEYLSGQDAQIVQAWGELRSVGFSVDLGYDAHSLKRYQQAAQSLAAAEVDEFFDRVSGKVSTEKASEQSEAGLAIVESVFSILHTKAVLRLIAKRNAELSIAANASD